MKLLIVLCALIAVALANSKYTVREEYAAEWKKLVDPHKPACIDESGINAEEIADMFARGHYPDDYKFKCYFKCILVKLNFMDANGDWDLDVINKSLKNVDQKHLKELTDSLQNEKDPCERAYQGLIESVKNYKKRFPVEN